MKFARVVLTKIQKDAYIDACKREMIHSKAYTPYVFEKVLERAIERVHFNEINVFHYSNLVDWYKNNLPDIWNKDYSHILPDDPILRKNKL